MGPRERTESAESIETIETGPGDRDRLREMLRACIQTGRITLSSGKVTDFYFDGRLVSLEPRGSLLIGKLILDELRARGACAIGGPTSGADPIVSAVGVVSALRRVPIHLFYVRRERKSHGTERRVEGPPLPEDLPGARVALADDVLTTGGSLLEARDAVREERGIEPRLACLLVDREEGGRERLEAAGLEVVALFTKREFV